MADLWSGYTDALIKQIDKGLGDKYKMSIGELLTNIDRYAKQQNIQTTVSNMQEDVNRHIDGMLKGMPEQVKAMEESMAKANEMTRQLSQNISMQARQHSVPFVKPFDVVRNTGTEETVQIDNIDDQVLRLVERLTDGAIMVVDFSASYKDYNIGSWLFDRPDKNYNISVYIAPNDATSLEMSREELDDLFTAASNFVRG